MILICSGTLTTSNIENYISRNFLFHLLRNIQSEDSREREFIKNLIYKLYASFLVLRKQIKNNIEHLIIDFVYESIDEEGNGISELLQIFTSIVKGYVVPLKEEHISFFKNYLLCLHRSKALHSFHKQLSICMQEYLKKEPTLFQFIILEISRHWPCVNSVKQVNCLNEIEEVNLFS